LKTIGAVPHRRPAQQPKTIGLLGRLLQRFFYRDGLIRVNARRRKKPPLMT